MPLTARSRARYFLERSDGVLADAAGGGEGLTRAVDGGIGEFAVFDVLVRCRGGSVDSAIGGFIFFDVLVYLDGEYEVATLVVLVLCGKGRSSDGKWCTSSDIDWRCWNRSWQP